MAKKTSTEKKTPANTQSYSVRYHKNELHKLYGIAKKSRILPGTYLRILLELLLEMYDRDGSISLPAVLVSRDAAEKAGIIPVESRNLKSEEDGIGS
jgi:hypothetical protein